MPQSADTNRAPRARLTFRVGIVGHRPNRLKNADEPTLRGVISKLLKFVQGAVVEYSKLPEATELYSLDSPTLRAITPLAEGTDRIFADEALNLGFDMCCPMPFAQEVYERDFVEGALEPNSLERFRSLLQRGAEAGNLVKFELNVDLENSTDPYGDAGRIVVNQSDLLLVVWDGEKAVGPGSTVYTVHEALRWHVPVIWIDAKAPHGWCLLRSDAELSALQEQGVTSPPTGSDDLKPLWKIVSDELSMPAPPPVHLHDEPERPLYHDYFSMPKARRHPRFVWKLFRDLVGSGKWTWQGSAVRDYVAKIKYDWPVRDDRTNKHDDSPETPAEWTNAQLRPHYAWSDQPADIFGDKYRSTYVFSYLFAAFAVVLALLPYACDWQNEKHHALQTACILSELVILALIIVLVTRGRLRRWHEHWIEYRILAELIRQLRLLIPLGGTRPFPHVVVAAHLADYGDIRQTWMYWQMRAVARATGVPNMRLTSQYMRDCVEYLAKVVGRVVPAKSTETHKHPQIAGGQYGFHDTNANRSAVIERRLYRTALTFLFLTIVAILVHLGRHVFGEMLGVHETEVTPAIDRWLMLLCAALPALGAALAGIENQGEFARIHKRSHAMSQAYTAYAIRLNGYLECFSKGDSASVKLDDVTHSAQRIAQLMVDEVVDWRVVFKDRPQKLS